MKLLSAIFCEEISDYTYPFSRRVFLRILAILVASGVAIWLLALAFDKFMITPVFCANAEHISICANSTSIASYVAFSFGGNYVGAGVGGIWYQATSASGNRGNCVVVGCYIMGWRILDFVIVMGGFGDSFGIFVVNLVK